VSVPIGPAATAPIAFLFDVDNTLLGNDRVRRDFVEVIDTAIGSERGRHFWEFYAQIRRECDNVDFPHTLELFSRVFPDERGFSAMADAALSYPSPADRSVDAIADILELDLLLSAMRLEFGGYREKADNPTS
jgi:hypothetical protein